MKTKEWSILVLFIIDIKLDDIKRGLDLQQLQQQADEIRRIATLSIDSTNVIEFYSSVDDGGRIEGETLFLPVDALVDSVSCDFFDLNRVKIEDFVESIRDKEQKFRALGFLLF